MPMFMNGTIMSAKMSEYHNGIDINLFDIEEEQTYKGQLVGGLEGLAELIQLKKIALKKGGVSEQELEEAASQVEMPPTFQPMAIRVLRVKTNKLGFTTLICDVSQ